MSISNKNPFIKHKFFILLILAELLHNNVNAVILTPPYFNLVANKKVEATATCGEGIDEPEFYCKLTGSTATDRETSNYANLIQGQYCYYCDPRNPSTTHHANYSIDGTEKWWQSPPLSRSLEYNQVNLTIDLGQEFHVAYIYIKMANSPRPGVWALEKSIDHGKTFTPWQYFADSKSECKNNFNLLPTKTIEYDDQVVCTTEYSKVLPVEGGEILLSLVNNRPNSKNFTHSDVLQNWTRATTVRLRLLRTKNLLGHLMAVAKQDPTVTRRYFYSIRDISIGGRCVCNGHAQMCDESNPLMPNKLICRCSHNTCGDQCQTCCPGFIQKKWRPNKEGNEFKCEPCQCYGHTTECVYDEEVERNKLSIDIHGNYEGGGVCQNCRDNTEGINCERCAFGYYRPFSSQINSTNACIKCECDNERSTGNCAQYTGQCECKPEFTGRLCDQCADGYTGWPNCVPCTCNRIGSENNACFAPCDCKFGYLGPHCDKCIDGYFGFPNCTECGCGEGRSSLNCDAISGQCMCRPGYTGLKCNECENGYFSNPFGGENKQILMCTLCACNQQGTTEEICSKDQGGKCICKPNYTGDKCDQCASGFFGPECEPCNCDMDGSQYEHCSESNGECVCKKGRGGAKCDQCAPSYFKFPDCLECNCDVAGSIGQSCDPNTGRCKCHSNFVGEKCDQCAPNLFNYPHCEECRCHPDGTSPLFPGCQDLSHKQSIICPCKDHVIGRQCDECRDTYYGLSNENEKGCSKCDCNQSGSLNELKICDKESGQCHCKHRVTSLGCSDCKSGSYSLERNNIFGCKPCQCQVGSSFDNECHHITGKCNCLNNIVGDTCDQPREGFYINTMHQLKFEIEDGFTKNSKPVRYEIDESLYNNYSWKGYVHLNRIIGEVTQKVKIDKPGTYRMIVNYINKNSNVTRLNVKVKPTASESEMDEQNAVVYLKPTSEPTFETVTLNQVSALTLELENNEYDISFNNEMKNFYIDYFILLPSDYFETTILEQNVEKACSDYRNDELCIQYEYLNINEYPHAVLADESVFETNILEVDLVKQFNHSYQKPLMAKKVNMNNPVNQFFNLPDEKEYVMLIDFMNFNEDGEVLHLEIDDDQTSVQNGNVYLYKCNLTTFCREVILGPLNDGLPLVIKADDFSRPDLNFVFTTLNNDVVVYKLTLIPKDKFHINHIKMAQHCIVKNGKCHSYEYQPLISTKIELDENEIVGGMPFVDYIQSSRMVFLNRHNPEVEVSVEKPTYETGSHMIIVQYYQPNHPSVNISVEVDSENKGSLQAPYCPSLSGCRGIVLFGEYGDEVFENSNIQNIKFSHTGEKNDEIWIDFFEFVAPENVDESRLRAHVPIKLTSDFISKCASNHFNIKHNVSDFCDRSVISMSAKYNDGALPCECDSEGSSSDQCNKFGGQCQCKENIIGRQCTRCKSGFYGFPDCKECNCTTGSCNETTGKCDCPINVEEKECKVCLDNYFGFHPKFGCQDCDCVLDSTKAGSNNCNKETGQCDCTENTDGRRCDRCKSGFYDYPACLECSCNRNGTTSEICDASNSECKCKSNVQGLDCSSCSEGTFNLERDNEDGCTKCFCFGQTSRCMSADLYQKLLRYFVPDEYEDWDEWKLSNANENFVHITNSTNHNGLMLNISSDMPGETVIEPIYWRAPKPFLGNKVTSYGSHIRYKLKIENPNDSNELNKPDLIITSNTKNMILIHSPVNRPESGVEFQHDVKLIESQFFHHATGSKVSREQLMQVLSSISKIELRAGFFDATHQSELVDFTFDLGVEGSLLGADLNKPVLSAERCACPPTFRGYSCESCEYGYYKTVSRGPGRFNCERCKCNGYADTCDQETGRCLECRGFTEGNNCERCKPGYHKIDNPDGSFECRLCPCPGNTEATVFADSCMIDSNSYNAYYCNCREGYYGNFCQRCAPGYFGNPRIGIPCEPCQCNGNIDMNDFDSCDQDTGECLKCLHNTTGVSCQECKHWYYGEPIGLKNCQECECNQCGSESCNNQTGECTCKSNVQGYNCASCGENQWGFNQCQGCNDCDCDPIGSTSSQCDTNSGQCKCKPGVDGRKCDRCQADHWNFSSEGCQNCHCAKAGVIVTDTGGFSCNSTTGYCSCIPGVQGKQCDECDDRWVLVKHQGCRKCDTCVDTLLDDIELLFMKADEIENGNKNSSLTFKAHNKLTKLEKEFNDLKEFREKNNGDLQLPLLSLQNSINQIRDFVLPNLKEAIEYPIVEKVEDLKALLLETQTFDKNVDELRNEFEVLKTLMAQLDKNEQLDEEDVEIIDNELELHRRIVEAIVEKNFNISDNFKEQLENFKNLNQTVQDLSSDFKTQTNEIDRIKLQNKYIQDSIAELKSFIEKAKNLDDLKEKDISFKAFFTNLDEIKTETEELQKLSENNLDEVNNLLEEANLSLESSNDDLENLDSKIDSLKELYENHDDVFNDLKEKCNLADLKSSNISALSQKWSQKVLNLQDGLLAFEMTQIYENIASNLNSANTQTLNTLNEFSNQFKSVEQLQNDTDVLKKDSKDLLASAQNEITRKNQVSGELDSLYMSYNELYQKKNKLESDLGQIDEWIDRTMASDETLTNLELEFSQQENELKNNDEKAKELIDKIDTLDSLRNTLPTQSLRDRRSTDDENLLSSIEETIRSFQSSTESINEQVESLKQAENINLELEQIRDDIYELKMLITSTRDIANEIKVAVNFTDASFINLRPSNNLKPSMVTSGSFYVQTRDMFAPIAYIYNTSDPNQYLSLNLQNGKPYFQYRISDKAYTSVTTDVPINNGEWHKIEIERVGRRATITVHTIYDEQETASTFSKDDSVVFNIDPNGANFILGQYPNSLPIELQTISLYSNQFKGAIDDVKLNGHSYGLWSYESARNIKGEPKRSSSLSEELIEQDAGNAISFEEDSFMCLDKGISLYWDRPISMTIRFKTHASYGLLWSWWENEGDQNSPYIAIYLESGYINVVYGKGNSDKYHLFNSIFDRKDEQLNDNKPHTIFVKLYVNREKELNILASETLVNDQTKLIKETTIQLSSFKVLRKGKQCIGGLPRNKRDGIFKNSMFKSFIGCMSQLLIPGYSSIDLQDTLITNKYHEKVSSGCNVQAEQCEFSHSNMPVFVKYDVNKYSLPNEETIGLSFATANPEGMLFYRQAGRGDSTHGLLLQIKKRKLVLTVLEDTTDPIEIESTESFSDNKLHSVYLVKRENTIVLEVDNKVIVQSNMISNFDNKALSLNLNVMYIAGIPGENSLQDKILNNFEGCITEVVYNDNRLNFKDAVDRSQEGMSFAECYKTPKQISDLLIPEYKKASKKIVAHYSSKTLSSKFQSAKCLLSKDYDASQLRPVGMRFGLNHNSRLEVHDSFPIKITTSIQLKFRTLHSEGLIFYASDAQFSDFLAIWLQEGYVNYAFDLGTGLMHIKTSQKYNDGRFHSLSATRDMRSGMLMIADRVNKTFVENIQGESQGSASSLTVIEPFYFGGIPNHDKQRLPLVQIGLIVTDPFIGCMSDFRIAYKHIRNRIQRVELMNCANNHESGTFFTGDSLKSHASLPDFVNLKDAYEISFEFKARTQDGVVLYIGPKDINGKDYALLELVAGELIYTLNIGGVTNKIKFTPEFQRNELCNSNWVQIKIRKEADGHISMQLKGTDVSSSFLEHVKIRSDLISDIYVGALPVRSKYADITETNEAFVGCIRDFSIMKSNNIYNSKVMLHMNLSEGVFNYCPLR